jgi:hypothetical protein
MRLVPTQSPGRGTRKARDFGSEIVELRAQGYTLDAIRAALANAGIHVTISTVWREANRAKAPPPGKAGAQSSFASAPRMLTADQQSCVATAAPIAGPVHAGRPDGKKQAELFMSTQITNPLIRARAQR